MADVSIYKFMWCALQSCVCLNYNSESSCKELSCAPNFMCQNLHPSRGPFTGQRYRILNNYIHARKNIQRSKVAHEAYCEFRAKD